MASIGRGVKDRGIDTGKSAGSKNVSGATGYAKTKGDGMGTKGSASKAGNPGKGKNSKNMGGKY